MVTLNKSLACAAIGAVMSAVSAGSARAAIVCSGRVCWHTHDSYKYPPHTRVVVHDDNWRWGPRQPLD